MPDEQQSPQRKMHKGNWTCGQCGGPITELPFKPAEDRMDQLKCRDCFKKGKQNRPQQKMHKGSWRCGKCGTEITELPFKPDPSRLNELQCRECHQKSRSF